MIHFESLKEQWKKPYVSRQEVKAFSSGMVHPRTLANLDSLGRGPKGAFKLHGKVFYPVDDMIRWMEAQAVQMN